MSTQITTAFVKQFGANVYHLAQQEMSRLRPYVRQETQNSETQFFDRIGLRNPSERTNRHGDTEYSDTPHTRRAVTLTDWDDADLIDNPDLIRTLIDPQAEYPRAFAAGFGRQMDKTIRDAALGSALTGKDAGSTQALPNTQKIHATTGSALSRLNVNTLRIVKKKFDEAEVAENDRIMVINAEQLEALLAEEEATSSDYNTIKALVKGDIDTFLGFKFIRTEQLLTASGSAVAATGAVGSGTSFTDSDQCFAYQKSAVILSVGQDYRARITEMPNKKYSTQVYAEMSIGGVRMEEVGVVEVLCKPSAS